MNIYTNNFICFTENYGEKSVVNVNLSHENYFEDDSLNMINISNNRKYNKANHSKIQNLLDSFTNSISFNDTFTSSNINNSSFSISDISCKPTKMNIISYYENIQIEKKIELDINDKSLYYKIPEIKIEEDKNGISYECSKNNNTECNEEKNNICINSKKNLDLENSNNSINNNINSINIINAFLCPIPIIPLQNQFVYNYLMNTVSCIQYTPIGLQCSCNNVDTFPKEGTQNQNPKKKVNNAKGNKNKSPIQIHPQRKKNPENNITESVLENIKKGIEKRSTIRIKNIPAKFSLKDIENLLNKSLNYYDITTPNDNNFLIKSRPYDLIYLPPGKKTNNNIGYAFVNLVNPMDILLLYKSLQNQVLDSRKKKRICEISFADVQGRDNMIKSVKNMTRRPVVYNDVVY